MTTSDLSGGGHGGSRALGGGDRSQTRRVGCTHRGAGSWDRPSRSVAVVLGLCGGGGGVVSVHDGKWKGLFLRRLATITTLKESNRRAHVNTV